MIHYTATGTGQPIILIHGFGEDSRIWDFQVKALAPSFRLILPDLPGAGKSAPEHALSMESMADAIVAVMEHEKIDQAVLAGHSMGGYVTLAFAEKYPEKLKGFSLVHSTAYADSEAKKEARRKSISFIRQHGTRPFLETATANLFAEKNRQEMAGTIQKIIDDNADILPESLIAFYEAMILRPDRTAVLKNSAVPVQFIAGKDDQAISFSDVMQQVHLPELSYIHILEQSGHMGMLEEPDKTNKSLTEFFRKLYI